MPQQYLIKEIFGPTIQGEGSFMGLPVLFLRFSGCNRWSGKDEDRSKSICNFCDTDFLGGERMYGRQIISKLKEKSKIVKDIVISGGEPLLQLDEELIKMLHQADFYLHLETNGSRPLCKRNFFHVSMSPKQTVEKTKAEVVDDIKILYPWIHPEITPEKFNHVIWASKKYIQPIDDDNYLNNLKGALEWIYKNPTWRLSPQVHKSIHVL